MSSAIIGVDAMTAKLVGVAAKAHAAIAKALYQEGEAIVRESKERIPVDTGTAKSSGFVDNPVDDGHTVRVTVGFGGAASGYIVPLHERLDVRHTNGSAKFLESVLNEHASGFAERIGAHIKSELGL